MVSLYVKENFLRNKKALRNFDLEIYSDIFLVLLVVFTVFSGNYIASKDKTPKYLKNSSDYITLPIDINSHA